MSLVDINWYLKSHPSEPSTHLPPTTEMNLKFVAISSLLVGSAIASTASEDTDNNPKEHRQNLANLISNEYKNFKDHPDSMEIRHKYHDNFSYKKLSDKHNLPFCSLSQESSGCEPIELDIYIRELRESKGKNAQQPDDETIKFFNGQVKSRTDIIFESLKPIFSKIITDDQFAEAWNDDLNDKNAKDKTLVLLKDQLLKFKRALGKYEPNSKNFSGIRFAMEALEGIVRFPQKSDEAVRVLIEELRSAKKDDKLEIITLALQKAHDKTSSPTTLAAYVSIALLLAFGILAFKHRKLEQQEKEESMVWAVQGHGA